VATMQHQAIGDWDAWRQYQTALIQRTEHALDQLTTSDLMGEKARVPPDLGDKFIGRLAGGTGFPLRLLDILEGFVYSHGLLCSQ